jgi:hypothetical protein
LLHIAQSKYYFNTQICSALACSGL